MEGEPVACLKKSYCDKYLSHIDTSGITGRFS